MHSNIGPIGPIGPITYVIEKRRAVALAPLRPGEDTIVVDCGPDNASFLIVVEVPRERHLGADATSNDRLVVNAVALDGGGDSTTVVDQELS